MPKARKPYTKRYVSWMGRARAMEDFLSNNGFQVAYTPDSAEIVCYSHSGFKPTVAPTTLKPAWWRFWK